MAGIFLKDGRPRLLGENRQNTTHTIARKPISSDVIPKVVLILISVVLALELALLFIKVIFRKPL
jgi:hypothetical protein